MIILPKLRIYPSQKHLLNILTRFNPTFLHTTNSWYSKKSSPTYYETLGLHQNATTKEIRAAFLKLSKQYHPDVTKNDRESHNRFLKINEAYRVLIKPHSRTEYNSSLLNESSKHENSDKDIANFDTSEVPTQNDYIFYASERNKGIHDKNGSFIREMLRFSVYTVVLVFGIAFFISSTADSGSKKLMNNPRNDAVYMSKDELERGELMWRARENGVTVYVYAIDNESDGQMVYVVCREHEQNSTDYVYRVLTSYHRP